MRFSKSFQLALNILIHSRLRSWLTIIGIVIGVAAIVAIVSIGQGAQATVESQLSGLGANIITVSPGFSRASATSFGRFEGGGGSAGAIAKNNLTDKELNAIKSVEGVQFVDGIVSGRVTMTYLSQTTTVNVQGVDPFAWQNMVTSTLASGRYLNPGDGNVVVIGDSIANSMFKQPLPVNREVNIEGQNFKVVGVLAASTGFGGGTDNSIIMPVQASRNIIPDINKQSYNSISVAIADPSTINTTTNAINDRLLQLHHVTNSTRDFSVTNSQATQARLASVTSTLTIFLGAIAAVSLIVGAVGIANTMFTSVLEKTKEIGIMKAIGAKNRDIMAIFLLNAGLVGFVGGLIGIAFGAAIAYVLPQIGASVGVNLPGTRGSLKTLIPLNLLIAAIVISVVIGLIAGAIPAYRASKLRPVDALRYE